MALTPESIAETWTHGDTVEIATTDDWNVFATYLNANPTAGSVRSARLIDNLDFTNKNCIFITATGYTSPITHLSFDGGGFEISNIVATLSGNFNGLVWFRETTNTTSISDVTVRNCYVTTNTATSGLFCVMSGYVAANCHITNSRFNMGAEFRGIHGGTGGVESCSENITVSLSSAITGGSYVGIYGHPINKCVVINDISVEHNNVLITDFDGSSSATTIGSSFSRSRVTTNNTGVTFRPFAIPYPTECYCANPLIGVATYTPFYNIRTNTRSYYDNSIEGNPTASAGTEYGLTTAELQSVATMQSLGWYVKAVE